MDTFVSGVNVSPQPAPTRARPFLPTAMVRRAAELTVAYSPKTRADANEAERCDEVARLLGLCILSALNSERAIDAEALGAALLAYASCVAAPFEDDRDPARVVAGAEMATLAVKILRLASKGGAL